MPVSPSRAARELVAENEAMDAGRAANESKFTEFRMACDTGHPPSCAALGDWWAMMRGDFAQAAELYTPACLEHKWPQACLNLGQMLGASVKTPLSSCLALLCRSLSPCARARVCRVPTTRTDTNT